MASMFKLRFPSGLSVYENRHILHSDMLWGAICNAANLLLGKDAVKALLQQGSVEMTSAFPFFGEELFFPKPFSFYNEPDDYKQKKAFKKVRFVSEEIWKQIISGSSVELKQEKIQGALWYEKTPKAEAFTTLVERPRVTLDRVTTSPTLFSSEETFYNDQVGFFFLANFSNDSVEKTFTTALRLLSDEGIGADRSVGKGWFTLEETTYQLPQVKSASTFLLLSLYTPTEQEINLIEPNKSFYEIVERGGWVTSFGAMTMRRKKIRAFAEGSVLYFKQEKPVGQIVKTLSVEQTQTHDVYRNAQAFVIPIRVEEKS